MRLLKLGNDGDGTFSLVEYFGKDVPPYAILSHTWGADYDEVTFKDLVEGTGRDKTGYRKIRFCSKQAAADGLEHFWIDTCCIDKSSSAELTEAINSMFRWYQDAAKCYVYLSDVSLGDSDEEHASARRWKPAFRKSRWFTRGWTLQELVAPMSVVFYSKEEQRLGDKTSLEETLCEITGIAVQALRNGSNVSQFTIKERMSWARKRETKREEDGAYSLLGIFGVHMPLIYGEGGANAFARLRKEIGNTDDQEDLEIQEEELKLRAKQKKQKEERNKKLLESLHFDHIDARQMTIENAHAETCRWLLGTQEYVNWLYSKNPAANGLLWIKGKPGTGKSTLMKFAFNHASHALKDRLVISFFFNARGHDLEKTTIGTYRSLLTQLLTQIPTLQEAFDTLSLSYLSVTNRQQWSIESLKTLLTNTLQLLATPVVCFIDALDECNEAEIRDMISIFEQLPSDSKFQVCLSSRHYPHITMRKGRSMILEGQTGHDEDIARYIDSKLNIGYGRIADQIKEELQTKSSGVFMWVIIVVGILNKEYDSGRIRELQQRLQEIPSDLHRLFHDILTRDAHNREELILCIQWILFSDGPMVPAELYFAIMFGEDPKLTSRSRSLASDDICEKFILNASKGLAEVTRSEPHVVQFIHESVKDFLLKDNGLGSIWPGLASNFSGQSHVRLRDSCLDYLELVASTHLEPSRVEGHEPLNVEEYPFLICAIRSVLYQADMAAGLGITQEAFIQSFPLRRWVELINIYLGKRDEYTNEYANTVSLMYILAERNLGNLIKILRPIFPCLEVEHKQELGTPLFAALARGSDKAIRAFVEVFAEAQSSEDWFRKIYDKTIGDPAIIRSLGSRFAQLYGPEFSYSQTRTTLSYLAELGDELLFALALKIGNVRPDAKDRDGTTPFWWAARKQNMEVVNLLCSQYRLDFDVKDANLKRTALSFSAEHGNEELVTLLLHKNGVDINSKDVYGRVPLWWAAQKGHASVVKLLLEKNEIDVNVKDNFGGSPLFWAAYTGHTSVVKLLLEHDKIDVNSEDYRGRTPLSLASVPEIRGLLLKRRDIIIDVIVHGSDSDGRTPMSISTW